MSYICIYRLFSIKINIEVRMTIISMFYGIIISMYYFDNQKHKTPHIHVKYQGEELYFQYQKEKL